MSRFLESICFSSGSYHLLDYHQERINRTFSEFYPKNKPPLLSKILPRLSGSAKQKVRVEYDNDQFEIGVSNYQPKTVSSLRLIEANTLDYIFKYADRSSFDQLMKEKDGADDILIIKNQLVTDCSYANVVFQSNTGWITPSSCLLNGVKRQKLLQENTIKEQEISVKDLSQFSVISLINAMLDPGEIALPVSKIFR